MWLFVIVIFYWVLFFFEESSNEASEQLQSLFFIFSVTQTANSLDVVCMLFLNEKADPEISDDITSGSLSPPSSMTQQTRAGVGDAIAVHWSSVDV